MATSNLSEGSKKNLIFILGEEKFGISLAQVKEVIGQTTITPVPDVPKFFCGLINLRGRIISIVDLKVKLGMETRSQAVNKPCIIISEIQGLVLGFKVDDVEEVVAIDPKFIEQQATLLEPDKLKFISGISRHNSETLTLMLDLHSLLNIADLLKVQQLMAGKESAA